MNIVMTDVTTVTTTMTAVNRFLRDVTSADEVEDGVGVDVDAVEVDDSD